MYNSTSRRMCTINRHLDQETKHFQEAPSCCFATGPSPPAGNDGPASGGCPFGLPDAEATRTESVAPGALLGPVLRLGATVARPREPVRACALLLLSRTRPRLLVHSRADGRWACSGPCCDELSCSSLSVGKSCPCVGACRNGALNEVRETLPNHPKMVARCHTLLPSSHVGV